MGRITTKMMPTIFTKVVRMKNVVGFMQLSFQSVQRWAFQDLLIDWFAGWHRCAGVIRCRHHLHTEVANFAQTQAGELRDGLGHLPKDVFDRTKTITAAEFLNKITQDFPVLPGLTRRA